MSLNLKLHPYGRGETLERMCSPFWYGGEGCEVAVSARALASRFVGPKYTVGGGYRLFLNTTSRRTRPRYSARGNFYGSKYPAITTEISDNFHPQIRLPGNSASMAVKISKMHDRR